MRRALISALVLCVAALGLFLSDIRLFEVTDALGKAGWGVVLVLLARLIVTFVLAIAWQGIIPEDAQPTIHKCMRIRIIRDAINSILPVAQVGGDVVGARLISMGGVAPSMAAASVVTDVFLQIVTQFVFTLAALALLIRHGGGGTVASSVAGGLLLAAPALLALFVVLRREFGAVLQRWLKWLALDRALGTTDTFYAALAVLEARRRAMTASAALHLLAWSLGSLEVWLAFHFMGQPIGLAEAFVIEALGHAVRGAAFAVPGGIGVQEAGLVIVSGVFGIAPEPALAMSLIKRAADLAIGIPGLVLWQRTEVNNDAQTDADPDQRARLAEHSNRSSH